MPRGLINPGQNLCYFNSLVQFLISIPGFAEAVADQDSELAKMYCDFVSSDKKYAGDMAKKLKQLEFGKQQDMHEGLLYFLEHVGSAADMFKHRYKQLHSCDCGWSKTTHTQYCHTFIITSKNIKDHIEKHVDTPEDYKCKCGGQITITNKLARLGQVIVLLFPQKKAKFPLTLDMRTGNYKIVAQSEHFGNRTGHYTCRAARQDKVYNFNDSAYTLSKFCPSTNTYMVAYAIEK